MGAYIIGGAVALAIACEGLAISSWRRVVGRDRAGDLGVISR